MEKTEKGQIIYEEYEDGSKAYITYISHLNYDNYS